jgi:hypothetical protein
LVFAAQLLALIQLAPRDERLGIKDLFLPIRLWSQVFQHLPLGRASVWLGGWGVSLILAGIFMVGGLSYWSQFLPGGKAYRRTGRSFR